jgi:hypothetical protein
MPSTQPRPILNTSLPPQFRQIHIELARESGHPEGDASVAYTIVAPLDADGRIDHKLWRANREACRIARVRPNEEDEHGHLVHHSGGAWSFHYDRDVKLPEDVGYHFADEHFVSGEYVSINERGRMHTYRVTSVSRL